MALIRDYELPGTGVVVPNAYHVVTDVTIKKRTANIAPPPDSYRSSGVTANHEQTEETAVYWKAGYIAEIAVTVWKDKAARNADAKPIGFIGTNPSDNKYGVSIGTAGMDHHCQFFLQVESNKNHIEQAYEHLLTTDYYYDCPMD